MDNLLSSINFIEKMYGLDEFSSLLLKDGNIIVTGTQKVYGNKFPQKTYKTKYRKLDQLSKQSNSSKSLEKYPDVPSNHASLRSVRGRKYIKLIIAIG